MKKIYLSMMAIAIAAFTFTSCEDVPEPYNNPYDQIKPSEPEVVIEPAGEGTKENPWNVAAVIEACSNLADGDFLNDGAEVFVTGIVTETSDISAQYGNATYYISDNAKASNKFYVFRGKLLDGAAVEADTDLQVGDSVTVCGKIKNYKGTMEFDQGNYLTFYKKGEGGGTTIDAPGTAEAPLTVAEALAYIDANLEADKQSPVGYVKGKIVAISDIDTGQYGNATYTISDDGKDENTLQIYRGYGFGGAKFKASDEIKAGDEVIVTGKLVNFKGNTKQFTQGSSIYSLNGKTADGGSGEGGGEGTGKGTADSPYNVTAAIAAGSGTGVYVKAYIVGNVTGQVLAEGAHFDATGDSKTNILIAASADETDVTKCMPVQLPDGAIRSALNLKENPGNYKKEVTLYGNIEKYFSTTGLKTVTFAILDGKEIGTNPAGGGTPSGEAKGSGTQADPWNVVAAINAINASNVPDEAFVKGVIVQLDKFNDQYGSITYWIADSKESTTKLQVYSGLGLDKAKFTALEDLAIGDEVVVAGKLKDYNGTPEFDKNNYLVSLTKGNGGSDTPGGKTTLDTNFKANGQGDWSITNVKALPEGVSYIWAHDSKYGMKASAFVNSTRYESDSWLVSPTISLPNGGTMSFKQALNYATSEYVKIMYTTTNGSGDIKTSEWKEASVDTWPAGNNWTFVDSKATLPAGTVRVAFRYTSTTDKAATWEIESASIK